MLIGRPTPNGTGIEIFGDYWDLDSLYNTLHAITTEGTPSNDVLLGFAYDVRKANANLRETDATEFNEELIIYRGFKYFWFDFFVTVQFMRKCANYFPTVSSIQADTYRLEAILESSLKAFDQVLGTEIFDWLSVNLIPENEYIGLFIRDLTYRTLTALDGPERFKQIREEVETLSIRNPIYKAFKKDMEAQAKFNNCEPGQLDIDYDFEGTGFEW